MRQTKKLQVVWCLIVVLLVGMPTAQALAAALNQDDVNNIYQGTVWYNPSGGSIGTCAPGAGSDPLKTAFDYFLGNRLSPAQAAAVVGNLDEESSLNPVRIQTPPGGTTNDPSSLTDPNVGWGIAQWSPGNKIIGIASSLGITGPIYDLATQLEIVLGEMKGTSPTGFQNLITGLQQISDITQATVFFQNNFESGTNTPARVTDAQQVYKQYGSDSGSSGIGCSGAVAGAGGCVSPFQAKDTKNISPERIDMGVDYAAPPGTPIVAMCDSDVIGVAPSGTGWTSQVNTQACVYLRITDGEYSGKTYYVCEDITPTVTKGHVNAGEVIATFLPSPTGLEMGWGSGTPYGSLAAQLNQQCMGGPGVDPGCWSTAAGVSFNKLLVSAGAPSGIFNSNNPAPPQTMPPGYP